MMRVTSRAACFVHVRQAGRRAAAPVSAGGPAGWLRGDCVVRAAGFGPSVNVTYGW